MNVKRKCLFWNFTTVFAEINKSSIQFMHWKEGDDFKNRYIYDAIQSLIVIEMERFYSLFFFVSLHCIHRINHALLFTMDCMINELHVFFYFLENEWVSRINPFDSRTLVICNESLSLALILVYLSCQTFISLFDRIIWIGTRKKS